MINFLKGVVEFCVVKHFESAFSVLFLLGTVMAVAHHYMHVSVRAYAPICMGVHTIMCQSWEVGCLKSTFSVNKAGHPCLKAFF